MPIGRRLLPIHLFLRMQTLFDLLNRSVTTHPDQDALSGIDRQPLSYARLGQEVQRGATLLAGRGVTRQDRVAIVLPNGPEMVVAFLAVGAIATCAPLNPAYSLDEFKFYLSDLNARLLVTLAGCAPTAVQAADALGIETVWLEPATDREAGVFDVKGGGQPALTPELALAEDVALVLHTSGTTARPKIVPLSQRNLVESAQNIAHSLALTRGDRCLNIMPLFHVHGLLGAVLSSISVGAEVVASPGYQPLEFPGWLERHSPTWFTAVPTMHQTIVARRQGSTPPPHRLRFIRSCSSALAPKLMAEMESSFGVPVIEALGMTESAHQVASNPLPPRQRKPGSVGVAAGPEVGIMNATGELLPPHATGEIVIRGANVMAGYENNPTANTSSFVQQWFRTGDQGHLDEEGYLFLTGRIKEIINRGGEKLSPREIDEALLDCPGVAQAVAFAVPDTALGEAVAAAVVLKPGAQLTEQEIRKFAGTKLTHFKVPARVLILEEIPKGPTGKIQRVNLARVLGMTSVAPAEASRAAHVAPTTELEKALVEIWQDVLSTSPVGMLDDVFDLGANSIAVTQVAVRVRELLGLELPLASFYGAPTLKEQAALLETRKAKGADGHGDASSQKQRPELRLRLSQQEYPLSFAQERFWFLWKLEPGSTAYHRPTFLHLTGALDLGRLQKALDQVVARHEVLRTIFPQVDGVVQARLLPPGPVPLPLHDLGGLEEEVQRQRLDELARAVVDRLFDLEQGPLIHATLVRLSNTDHVLLLGMHHAIADAWSASVVQDELAKAYGGAGEGQVEETLPPSLQYADYAAWQRECADAGVWADDLTYWKEELKGALPVLDLPYAKPRRELQQTEAVTLVSRLTPESRQAWQSLCKEERVTPFMVLAAALGVLLHRHSGQEEVILGCPVAGRTELATESMLGCFINTLALRLPFEAGVTFREMLGKVRAKALHAYEHQALPFEKVVEAVHPERHLHHTPVFQCLFIYREQAPSPVLAEGLNIGPWDRQDAVTPFDLCLDVTESGDGGLICRWQFNAGLLPEAAVRTLGTGFETLLSHLGKEAGEPVSRLRILPEAARAQLIHFGTGALTEPSGEMTVTPLIKDGLARDAASLAIVSGEQSMSRAELEAASDHLAARLKHAGLGQGSRVGLCVERSPAGVVAVLGILKSGAAYVPISPTEPSLRLATILADSDLHAVVGDDHLVSQLPLAEGVKQFTVTDSVPVPAADLETLRDIVISPEDPAYVLFTSGSTGRPKGVLMPHRSLAGLLTWHLNHPRLGQPARTLQFAPFTFDVSFQDTVATLATGGVVVMVPEEVRADAKALLAWIEEHHIERLYLPFVALQALAEAWSSRASTLTWAAVRDVICAGECLKLTPEIRHLFEALPEARLHNHYGPTECHVVTAETLPEDPAVWPVEASIGVPTDHARVYVLDALLQPVPVGVPGELCLGGSCVALGYVNAPANDAAFVDDPFAADRGTRMYRTGDRACWTPDGKLSFLGRLDRQIKVRGYRIEPGEVESALMGVPGVKACAVILRDGRLGAWVAHGDAPPPTHGEVLRALRESLPEYMLPQSVEFLRELPLLPSGKVDLQALPSGDSNRPQIEAAFVPPQSELEQVIAAAWGECLNVKEVGVEDNFFDLGGHSLLMVRLHDRLQARLQRSFPLMDLFQYPTIRALLLHLEARPDARQDVAPAVDRGRKQREVLQRLRANLP